jgi:hypothetical protein
MQRHRFGRKPTTRATALRLSLVSALVVGVTLVLGVAGAYATDYTASYTLTSSDGSHCNIVLNANSDSYYLSADQYLTPGQLSNIEFDGGVNCDNTSPIKSANTGIYMYGNDTVATLGEEVPLGKTNTGASCSGSQGQAQWCMSPYTYYNAGLPGHSYHFSTTYFLYLPSGYTWTSVPSVCIPNGGYGSNVRCFIGPYYDPTVPWPTVTAYNG